MEFCSGIVIPTVLFNHHLAIASEAVSAVNDHPTNQVKYKCNSSNFQASETGNYWSGTALLIFTNKTKTIQFI